MLASEFNKLEVYAGGMTLIGKVKDQSIDTATYTLTDLVVQLRKDAARRIFGKRFTLRGMTVRVPVSEIDRMGDAVILKLRVDQLAEHIRKA
jgi:sporulation protein YlmC with PRC-barrel domain